MVASLVDNFVHVPGLYIPSFYLMTNLLRGETFAGSYDTLRSNWKESVALCALFWLPAQFVIFSAVPAGARVRCVAAGDFVWNTVLSYLAHRADAPAIQEAPARSVGDAKPQQLCFRGSSPRDRVTHLN